MKRAMKYARLIPFVAAAILLVASATAGCSGGYGGPSGPDTSHVATAAAQ
ncbi:MAG TPA: hypothetical protein VG454_07415 [Gemmatimonadales bacterium]|nr:hypothetical protein [Gemmatimonadales bacterium]